MPFIVPVAFRPCAAWKAFRAAPVLGPHLPSTVSGGVAPFVFSAI